MHQNEHLIEREELMAYLDGELPADRAATAAAHLERCRECQGLAADLQSVSRQLRAWQIEPPNQQMPQSVAAALEERGQGPQNTAPLSRGVPQMRWRIRPWILGLASACLILILLVSPRLNSRRIVADMVQTNGPLGALMAPDTQVAPSYGRLPRMLAMQSAKVARAKPMIVRTAQLTLTTSEFDKTRDRIEGVLKRYQGYVGQLSVTAPVGAARALEASLRVPADQLDAAIAELKKLGRVELESQSGEEVTQQYVDLEARLSNARNTEQRLTELLRQRTGKLADVLAVEKEVDEVRGEIERMEAEKKGLTNRVDFATLNVKVTEEYKAELQVSGSTLTRLRNASVEGYRTMVEGCISVVLFLLAYGPSFLIWGALSFFPVRGAWRKLRRARPA